MTKSTSLRFSAWEAAKVQDPVDNPGPSAAYPVARARSRSGLPWWGWLLILGVLAVPACGVVAAMGMYGVRKYIENAKVAEARAALPQFAQGVVACAKRLGNVPSTSAAVPAQLTSIAGKKYQSSSSEWTSDEVLLCTSFALRAPQYFQYQWVRESERGGHVQALADLDGDGAVDQRLRLPLACAGGTCTAQVIEQQRL